MLSDVYPNLVCPLSRPGGPVQGVEGRLTGERRAFRHGWREEDMGTKGVRGYGSAATGEGAPNF